MRLGKLEPQRDARNLKLRAVLRADAPAPPPAFDVDVALGFPPHDDPMFANDLYGDCVIAGRAHQTRRMELADQGGLISIDEQTVIDEYLFESGGADNGLIVLPSLRAWRQGWSAWKPSQAIQAFAEVYPLDHDAVKAAICGACGIGIGMGLPLTADAQIRAGQPWEVAGSGPAAARYSWGGHYVYVVAYDADWLTCITWGKRQQLSWAFLDAYCDEAYAVTDAKTPSYGIVDVTKVHNFLRSL